MSWNKDMSSQRSLEILGTLAGVCAKLGGPLSRELNELVVRKEWLSLVTYEIDYKAFSNADVNDVIYARQILGLFQKLEFLNLGIDKEKVASERFVLSEQMCDNTNRRFASWRDDPSKTDHRVTRALLLASQKIAMVLGDLPPLTALAFAFGPGANTNVKGTLACPRAKLSAPLECSANLTPIVAQLLQEVPAWTALHAHEEVFESSNDQLEFESFYRVNVIAAPGKVTFVPKNAKTYRSIVIEPLLNSFFQKGIGSYMKDRLLSSGVNLFDQTLNQRRACEGSGTGRLATIDLSMASDCVAKELVFSLLPFEWSDLLDSLRSSSVTLPDSVEVKNLPRTMQDISLGKSDEYYLKKFSSMGNGFTFELESVIFYGLCFAACEVTGNDTEDISVYGDDLVVPVSIVPFLEELLDFAGFAINREKSYSTGFFRESCGADYFYGIDIRPFYQKTKVSERTLFTMHNWFIRHGERKLALAVDQLCNPVYKLYGPDGYGDGHLIGSYQTRQNRELKRRGWEGGFFDTYSLKSRGFHKPLLGDAILPVYSVYTRSGQNSPTDPNVVRGSNGYAKISIYTLARSIFSRATS